MSLTGRKSNCNPLPHKLQPTKLDFKNDATKASLAKTVKLKKSLNFKKGSCKTGKSSKPTDSRMFGSAALQVPAREHYKLDKSKDSKESKMSLNRSANSYCFINLKKRSVSTFDKHIRRHRSKELPNLRHLSHNIREMKGHSSTHKKKESDYTSGLGSKLDLLHFNKHALSSGKGEEGQLKDLLAMSEAVLWKYQRKNEYLYEQNKKYKKKYQQAVKKIRSIQGKK